MKVFNLFAHVFAIFAFLTLGSLLMIIAFHIITFEDALLQLRQLYNNPWRSVQTGFVGVAFIIVGLSFARMLVKKRRQAEALIYQTEIGPIVVSVTALEDVVKKVLKRFHLVKEWKTKIMINGKDVEIKLRLVLWASGKIQELLTEVQEEIRSRIKKMLGPENRLEIICDVQRIEDHEAGVSEIDPGKVVSL
jgi:hypothetical protein